MSILNLVRVVYKTSICVWIHAEDPSLILATYDGKLEREMFGKLLCIVTTVKCLDKYHSQF
jgi:hypothetical protein